MNPSKTEPAIPLHKARGLDAIASSDGQRPRHRPGQHHLAGTESLPGLPVERTRQPRDRLGWVAEHCTAGAADRLDALVAQRHEALLYLDESEIELV